MSLNLSNRNIKDIYLGATKIKEGYIGSVKVYGKSPVYKDRYEFTLFENNYGGVSSGTVSDAFMNYDMIGIRLSNDNNTTEPRKTRGANWVWINKRRFNKDSGSTAVSYRYYDGKYFCNLLCYFNYDNVNKSFNISVTNTSSGWNIYTKADDDTRMYSRYTESDLLVVSKIIGVKYQ